MELTALPALFSKKLTAQNLQKVNEVCARLKLNPMWLLAVMYFETGRTFSPSATNGIGSVGLIQFTRDKKGVEYKTIGGKPYALADLKNMTFDKQMDVVEAYYKEAMGGRKISSFIDTYLVTFFPAALGESDDYVFQTKGLSASLIAKQNPAFDKNKDGLIHKAEVTEYFRGLYNGLGVKFDEEINVGSIAKSKPVIAVLAVFFYTVFTACICI